MRIEFLRFTALLTAVITILTAGLAFFRLFDVRSNLLLGLTGAIIGAAVASYLAFFLRTLNKNPTPLRIALIGPPRAGKTVYLSVLFQELESSRAGRIDFQAYGRETIEEVNRNLRTLSSGDWLPRTVMSSSHFTFRANAAIGSGLFSRRFTIEIGDYAGEHVEEFDSSSEAWLHRGEYFKSVVGSDALFLVADGELLTRSPGPEVQQLQHSLLAALQVFIDEKGVAPGEKIRTPVGVIVTKSDLFNTRDIPREIAMRSIQRLLDLAMKRCRHMEVFFVSAVGEVGPHGELPASISPTNVIDPIAWALPKVET